MPNYEIQSHSTDNAVTQIVDWNRNLFSRSGSTQVHFSIHPTIVFKDAIVAENDLYSTAPSKQNLSRLIISPTLYGAEPVAAHLWFDPSKIDSDDGVAFLQFYLRALALGNSPRTAFMNAKERSVQAGYQGWKAFSIFGT
jgi:hypothetical protein